MITNHKLQLTLDEIKEISRIDLALFSEKGKLLAATYDVEDNLEKAIHLFANSMAESQMLSSSHFFKVVIDNELEYILISKSGGEESYMIGRLVVCQIRNIILAYQEQFDRNNFMQNVVLGNMLIVDMYNKAKRLRIEQTKRVVYVIQVSGKKNSSIIETVKSLFSSNTTDYVTEVDESSIVLIKSVQDCPTEQDLVDVAKIIVDNLQTEAMVKVRVGYGNRVELLQDIPRSYQEARMALEVGSIFYADQDTISYDRLGIGRLIYQLPLSLCEMFLKEIFGEHIPETIDEESTVTIHKFFENNLNISETARQLYLHRNTLVYRLERIQKTYGLDIRVFEDAMLFKIAIMVISHMKSQEKKEKER